MSGKLDIPFYKYHGAGNDFVIVDNRSNEFDFLKDQQLVANLCHRRFGIGSDGLMMVEGSSEQSIIMAPKVDFEMIYFNADGHIGSLCGNGGRCIVALAHRLGIIRDYTTFKAADGLHEAKVISTDYVELKMAPVSQIDMYQDHAILDTGSPHYVQIVNDVERYPVVEAGSKIRYSSDFPQGINVNFIEPIPAGLTIRTYERGVEDETWACGTGATAAALAYIELAHLYNYSELNLEAKGGTLKVRFNRQEAGHFEDIWLCGGAEFVYEGTFSI